MASQDPDPDSDPAGFLIIWPAVYLQIREVDAYEIVLDQNTDSNLAYFANSESCSPLQEHPSCQ